MGVLVTGADGFVGQHLVDDLLEEGRQVAAASLTLPPSRTILSPSQMAAVDWKGADVREQDALFRLLAAVQPDRIYHLAGFASGDRARYHAAQAMEVNAGGTVNLCEAIVSVRDDFPDFDPRVLVMGAGDAYGNAGTEGQKLTEDLTLRPMTTYGMSKAAQEIVAHTYRRAHSIDTVVARGFNLVGPGQETAFVVPDFCEQAAAIAAGESEPVLRVGNLDAVRDFTDVRDGVEAFRLLVEAGAAQGAYNVCSGVGLSVRTLLDWILDEAGIDPEIRVDEELLRGEEVGSIVGDPTRLRELTGWEPRREVEESVREVYRWTVSRE